MAAESVGEIGLDLVVNQNQFNRQMQGITGLAKKAGIALAAAFSVKKIVEFGKECVNLGSDLAEVQNVVDVTFPKMTAQVEGFAKDAASSFGLSETMAKRFTGTFGAMAKAFGFSENQAYEMSTTLTGLAGDVASFYNLSQDEAYTKLKSVFTGETETLKDLGVVMTQNALDAYAMANGYGKTTQAMSEAEKVALRYAFVQQQLSAASGDFIRTSDSWANQVRILKLNFDSLKATIGQGLINVLTPVLKVINSLLGKLTTLANAFKSFTELITGKKSSGSSSISSGVSELASAAGDAGAGLSGASGAANNLGKATKSVGNAAKKAAKEMRALMGFDKVNKLSEQSGSDDSGSSSPSGGGGGGSGGGGLGDAVDYGNLAEGDTALDKLDDGFEALIKRVKELAELFKTGFEIGFGDSEKKIDSIRQHVEGIGKSLKDIFTDEAVVEAANKLFDSIALNAGKVAGSMASIGLTIVDNFLGGIDGYLQKSKTYIKERIISIFDVSADIFDLMGDYHTAFADVFSVFSGENATNITTSIIGIFSDSFLGVLDLAGMFARDITGIITVPFVKNKDLIKSTIDATLAPISEMLQTLHDSIKETFEKLTIVYDEHVAPMFKTFQDGWSEIVNTLLESYNEYIAPILDEFSEKFKTVWESHIQPTIDMAVELLGKLADLIKILWETVLQPFIDWIANNIFPIIAPILKNVGEGFLGLFATVGDVAGNIIEVLGGIVDFVAGVFSRDWKRAWSGIKSFFSGIWKAFVNIVKSPINTILGFVNAFLRGIQSMVNGIANALNCISIDLPGWLEDLTGYSSVGFNIPRWSAPQIPYLAQGGYVKPNTPQLAMIGDNRHQGEVVAPEDKLQDMVNKAVRMAAGTGGVTKAELESIINNAVMRIVAALSQMGFFIDGQLMARALIKASEELSYRENPVKII